MPKPRGHNPSVYLIMCSRRIRDLAVGSSEDHILKLVNASDAAAQVVSQLEVLLWPKLPDVSAIRELQHYIMDHLTTMTPAEAGLKVVEMFELLDKLEQSTEHEY